MPHTSSRFQQDLGFSDGIAYTTALSMVPAGAGAPTGFPTRNGAADFSWNVGAATGPVTFSAAVEDGQIFRTGFGEDTQNQFGGTGIPASAQPQPYRPDVIPAMGNLQQITPRTALKKKGIKPLSIKVVELITGAALTTHNIRMDSITHVNNVANTITSVLANGANGLPTATQANPYVTVIPFPVAQQVYQITDLTTLWVELTVTTAGGGAYRLYSVEITFEFNYN